MSTATNGYIVDGSVEDGVAIIPAPPSSDEVDSVNPKHGGVSSAVASVSSSCPSRDSISAAIAFVRAKQMAKSAILRAQEEQILHPRSVSSDQTAASLASESSRKDKVIIVNENENAALMNSTNKTPADESLKDEDYSNSGSQQLCSSSASIPERPSFEQTPDEPSDTVDSSSSAIPAPPSFESGDGDKGDAGTIDDVNDLLSRLGVGSLHSESKESLDRLRVVYSNASGASSDATESKGSSALSVQPETLEEISAIIDAVREEHLENEVLREQSDPPGPSPIPESDRSSLSKTDTHSKDENPFIDHYHNEDEKKGDEKNERNVTHFGDESFAADVRKTLSTVKEVASMEADDDDITKEDYESNKGAVNVSQPAALLAAVSEEQESVYGEDGRKEPKGVYDKANIEVEKIPVSNIGVEQAIKKNASLMSNDSQNVGTNRYMGIGHDETQNKSKESQNNYETNDSASVISQGFSDTGPWAIRDVASEETLRATGRRRPHFIVSGPRPSHKSRNAVSLFDDTSVQASETASEFRSGLSFGSDNRSEDNGSSNNKEEETEASDSVEIETSDSVEADNRCMIDTFLYNKYEPENDYKIEGGKSSGDQSDKPIAVDNVGKETTSTCDTGEVETMEQDQSEEVDNLILQKDPSGDMRIRGAEEDAKIVSNPAPESKDAMAAEEKMNGRDSNPFLRQFEALGLGDDSEDDGEVQPENDPVLKSQADPVKNTAVEMSPAMLVKYFSNIKFEGENEEKLVKDFERLMIPVMNGKIPTIIEEAQIRQAALKADVPLNFVDAFVDHVKDEKFEVAPQLLEQQSSKSEEKDFLAKGWEEIEDLDEDDAIAVFLSSKIDVQDLNKEEICKIAEETSRADAERRKKEDDLLDSGSRDYEPSVTQGESDFNKSKDSEVEVDSKGSGESEVESIRSEEESDSDESGVGMSAIDDHNETKISLNETQEISIENDHIDKEMLKACKRIQCFDEGIWQRRAAMAKYGWEWEEATWISSPKTSPSNAHLSRPGIHSLTASRDISNFMFNRRSFPLSRKYCKLSYIRREKSHAGYFDVDVYSLQESAACGKENMFKDETPWELRHVRQRFLHERSLTFSRNWFGDIVKTRGNDKIKAPVCKPKSMEMPMRNVPDPGDWTPEWYTTWGGRKFLSRRPSLDGSVDSGADSHTEKDHYDTDSLRSYSSADSTYEEDEDLEDAPECGTFVNTKLKIGEHVTRVHPDYTSSLRKSRWRKKYFPIGTFPY